MQNLIEFTADGITPQRPSIATVYGLPVPGAEENLNNSNRNAFTHAARVGKHIRTLVPGAFEAFDKAVEAIRTAENEQAAIEEKLQRLPSTVDAHVAEMEGEIEDASAVIKKRRELEFEARKAEAAAKVARRVFYRMAEGAALKRLNEAVEAEAARRAAKAQESAKAIAKAADSFLKAVEEFDSHEAQSLTTAAASSMPIDDTRRVKGLVDAMRKGRDGVDAMIAFYAPRV